MRRKHEAKPDSAEKTVRDIRRATRRPHAGQWLTPAADRTVITAPVSWMDRFSMMKPRGTSADDRIDRMTLTPM